uniref:cGMP-dependent protein kinase interacting domain-containing protein n=1 Tax=Pipistrellus kuhlii TaxID=59472 RepID=A0A7J8B2K0_PIPKU|nr:hypothetical protein mPipKuh1_007915 [Pipistrellus kuhlii]
MAEDINIQNCNREECLHCDWQTVQLKLSSTSALGSGSWLQKPNDLVMTVPEAISFRQTNQNAKKVELKVEVEHAMQRKKHFAERSAILELKRFECKDLQHKATELEEELKGLSNLRADNQCLKDENVALIISKLSK